MASRRFSIEAIFKAVDHWTPKLSKMGASVSRFNSKLDKNLKGARKFEDQWRDATGPLRSAGKAALTTAAATSAVAGAALKDVIDEGASFEKTMVAASTKFGDAAQVGTEEFEKLKRTALDVGQATEHSAQEAAGALKFMAKAGEDPTVAMQLLGNAADFATANEMELARATDIMSDAMGGLMGKADGAAQRVDFYRKTMDLMTFASNKANMDVEDMFEGTKKAAAMFRSAGQDASQFTAALSVLASQGVKGARAGTALKTMMVNLTAATPKAKDAMKKINFDPFEFDKDGKRVAKDFDKMIAELSGKLAKLDEEELSRFKADVIGKEANSQFDILVENAKELQSIREEAQKVLEKGGFAAEQAKRMRATTEGMLKEMDSSIQAVKLEVFEEIKGDVQAIVKEVTAWAKLHKKDIAKGVKDAIVFLRENLPEIIKWGKRIGILVATFIALDTAIKGVTITLKTLQAIRLAFAAGKKLLGWAGAAARGMDTLTGSMKLARTEGGLLNTVWGKMGPTARGLGAGLGIVGAAFAGWRIGQWLNETFQADERLKNLLSSITGLDEEIERVNKKANRAAANTQAEIIARKKGDIKELEALIADAGFGDTISGVNEERIRELTRLKSELSKLQTQESQKTTLEAFGFQRNDRQALDAYREMIDAGGMLDAAKGDLFAEPQEIARLEKIYNDANRNFQALKESRMAEQANTTANALPALVPAGGPAANGPATGAPLTAPAPAPSATATDAATEDMRQMLEALRKQNELLQKQLDKDTKPNIEINTAADGTVTGSVDGEPLQVPNSAAL